MRDLTSPDTFRKNNANDFDKTVKRVLTSDEWDDKLEEIKEWEEEQERLKHQGIEDGLGPELDYTDEIELSPEEKARQLQSTKRTQYAVDVDSIRQELGINQNSTFGPASMGVKPKSNFLSKWRLFAKAGRSLSTLEIENNKKLLSSVKDSNRGSMLDGLLSQGPSIKETPEQQEFRMNNEDWKTYLYSYRLSLYLSVMSLAATLMGVGILFAPAYYALTANVMALCWFGYQLGQFNDGPLKGNFFGSEQNLESYQKFYKEQQAQKEQEKPANNGMGGFNSTFGNGGFNSLSDSELKDKFGEFPSFDDDEEEVDFDSSDSFNESSEPVEEDTVLSSNSNNNDTFVDDGTSIPPSTLDVTNDTALYEAEEEFLKMVYRNRAELSGKLNQPYDILKLFAPLIVNFNKEFAETKQVSRNSWTFKNIAYLIGNTYNQISSTFKNAGIGKDAEYDRNYYFFIDSIEETGLFYKVKVRLPEVIKRNDMIKNMDTMKGNLRETTDDVVDISTELPNQTGYFKIFKITTSSSGSSFMPLVSTGDVLRFKNMKTTTGKDLIKQLNAPEDLNILFGLSDAENALTLDIAGNQNTSIAVAGFTGSGKTASTGSWLANLLVTHSPDELGIIIVDPKSGSFWENLKLAPHVLGFFGREELDKVPSMMDILNDVVSMRQNHLNKKVLMKNYYEARRFFKRNEDWERLKTVPRLLVVMDEQLALISDLMNRDANRKQENKSLERKDKKFDTFFDSYNSQVGALANVIREGGITIMALSQRTDNKSFPRSLLAGSSIKFMMKLKFAADAGRLMGEDAEYPDPTTLPVGSGYLTANGLNLAQLTTPLFSGNPDKLEEVTRIIALAWAIIYDYDHDLNKEPPYYYLSEASKKNVDKMKAQSIDIYNIFNRDKIFSEVKEILRGEIPLHFVPDYTSKFSLDLDKPAEQQVMEDVRVPQANRLDQKEVEQVSDKDSSNQAQAEPSSNEPSQPKVAQTNQVQTDQAQADISNEDIPFETSSNEPSSNEPTVDEPNSSEPSWNEQTPDETGLNEPDLDGTDLEEPSSSEPSSFENSSEQASSELAQYQFVQDKVQTSRSSEEVQEDIPEEPGEDNMREQEETPYEEPVQDNVSLGDLIKQKREEQEQKRKANQENVNNFQHEDIDEDVSSEYSDMAHRYDYESEYMKEALKNESDYEDDDVEEPTNAEDYSDTEVEDNNIEEPTQDGIIEGDFTEIVDEPKDTPIEPSSSEPVQEEPAQTSQAQAEPSSSEPVSDYDDSVAGLIQFFQDEEITALPNNEVMKYFSMGTLMQAVDKKVVSISKDNKVKFVYK